MADLQKTSQVVGQVLTQDTGKQKTSQVVGQVLTQDTGKQKVSQIVGQVLCIDYTYGPHTDWDIEDVI